jgi:hypothetical protein
VCHIPSFMDLDEPALMQPVFFIGPMIRSIERRKVFRDDGTEVILILIRRGSGEDSIFEQLRNRTIRTGL